MPFEPGPGQRLHMVVAAAEGLLDDHKPPEQLRHVDFVGHADRPVNLDGAFANEFRALANLEFCRGKGATFLDPVRRLDMGCSKQGGIAGEFGMNQHVDHHVLQRLKTPDRDAELPSLSGI